MGAAQGTKFFARGWFMVLIVFITVIVTQGFSLYSFSMIKVPLTEMLKAEPTQVAMGFSMYVLVVGFASLIVGDIIDRIGLKRTLILSAIIYSAGYFIIGTLDSLWMLYVAYFIMGFGNALGGMVLDSGIPSNWFVKRRGLAVGIIMSAMFPGSIIATNLVSFFASSGNWQMAAIVMGVISFIVLFISAFILKWRPQDVGLLPDGMSQEEAALEADKAAAAKLIGLNRKQAFKTTSFWLLFAAFALIGIGEQGPFQNMPTFLIGNGYDLAMAGTFMTFLAFAGVCGKLVSGLVIDRVGPRVAYPAINLLAAGGLVIILVGGSNMTMLYIGGFLFGAALSSSTVCFSTATAKYLGPKYFAQLYGIIYMGKPVMDAVGVPLIADVSGGPMGWTGAFAIAIFFIVASAVCMLLARKNKKLVAMEQEAARSLSEDAPEKKAVPVRP